MQYQIGPPPMNPLTRILAGLFGLLALVGAFVFGFVILAVAVAVGLVAFLVFQLRFWWLRRKFGADQGDATERAEGEPRDANVIDAEYEVVSRKEE